ncbi:MAG: NADH-quinone oxidoreductase subunit NuoH [Phycisphaerae bacterium]|nr:NADH-quinone oxidoreductase subunit NuoH [Phycisphaerae bacterium]
MAQLTAQDIINPKRDHAQRGRAIGVAVLLSLVLGAGTLVGLGLAVVKFERNPVVVFGTAGLFAWFCAAAGTAVSIRWYAEIGRLLARLAPLLFWGSVAGLILVVWACSLLYGYVDHILDVEDTYGAGLTISNIQWVLEREGHWVMWAWPLWMLQFSLTRDAIGVIALLGWVCLNAMFAIWWERKIAGRIQSRLGPMRVGRWHGWAQCMADGLKLVQKEDLIPTEADRLVFRLAPYLAWVPVFSAFIALPFGAGWVFRDLDVTLLFIFSMLGVDVVGVIVGGWASNNKWSVYGAIRVACQMVSYEIPMGMSLLVVIMTVGTLQLSRIGGEFQAGGFHTWLAFSNPFTFVAAFTFFISSLASCKRAPFDLPEAESELVAGFHTEYSGFRWALYFFAEYAAMFIIAGLTVILFFGAWHSPLPASWGSAWAQGSLLQRAVHGLLFSGPLWFIAKCFFFIFCHLWLRWTLPRLRIDQVMYTCVQVLLPMTMVLLLANTFWILWVPADGRVARIANIAMTLVGAGLAAGFVVIMCHGLIHRRKLVGTLAVKHLPGA